MEDSNSYQMVFILMIPLRYISKVMMAYVENNLFRSRLKTDDKLKYYERNNF
jgi:hypothetical protein